VTGPSRNGLCKRVAGGQDKGQRRKYSTSWTCHGIKTEQRNNTFLRNRENSRQEKEKGIRKRKRQRQRKNKNKIGNTKGGIAQASPCPKQATSLSPRTTVRLHTVHYFHDNDFAAPCSKKEVD
jgi:hypothetical protein